MGGGLKVLFYQKSCRFALRTCAPRNSSPLVWFIFIPDLKFRASNNAKSVYLMIQCDFFQMGALGPKVMIRDENVPLMTQYVKGEFCFLRKRLLGAILAKSCYFKKFKYGATLFW